MVDEWARIDLVPHSASRYAPGRAQVSVKEHDEIVDLIEEGADPATIEAVVRQHELNTVEAVVGDDGGRSGRDASAR